MKKSIVVLDIEVYINYILILFKNQANKLVYSEIYGEESEFSSAEAERIYLTMKNYTTVGFNSLNYDLPIIAYAISGATCKQIYEMSNDIIKNRLHHWQTNKKYGLNYNFNHIDLIGPAPAVMVSLKLYGARMHSTKLQDLPIEPDELLSDYQTEQILKYCENDVDTTFDLYNSIKERLDLRALLQKEGYDVISKSDAQIAEQIIKYKYNEITGMFPKSPSVSNLFCFKFNTPSFIKFESEQLNKILNSIKTHTFELNDKGNVILDKELSKPFVIGNSKYRMGLGGLHTVEKNQTIIADDDNYVLDKDVTSYYPSIILNNDLYPKHLGNAFLKIYGDIVKQRIEAKKNKNHTLNQSLKIVINGTFGKLGNKYSFLYAPDLLIQVTLTGQLSLLMLIERLTLAGFNVVSANTDGLVSVVPKKRLCEYESICFQWELETGFNLEDTYYKALYSRDVNNYFAIKNDGTVKTKGAYKVGDLTKNPQGNIIYIAVINYFKDSTPIEKTIKNCKDIRDFLIARRVNGGATYKGNYVGKVVRWYYCNDGDKLLYKKPNKTGNYPKVPNSDDSKPFMNLNDEFPKDLNYNKYIEDAKKIINDLNGIKN